MSALGVAMAVVVMWQIWLPIDFPPLALLGACLPFLAVLSGIMLMLALGVKSKGGLFFSSLALLGLLVSHRSAFLPHRSSTVSGVSSAVRVMTFNLRYEYYEPADLAATILSQGADVVAVQEIAPSVMPELTTMLEQQLPFVIPASPSSDLALFSRYPVIAPQWFNPGGDGREALHVMLDVEGQRWHIFAVHPLPAGIAWLGNTLIPIGLYYGNLEVQMADVLERAQVCGKPTVVLGDFNMAEHSRAYRLLSRQLTDAFYEGGDGLGFTFPQDVWIHGRQIPGPFVRLDYIFHSSDLQARHAEVICRGASDHCLVTADLTLRP